MALAVIVGPSCGVCDWIGCDWLAEPVEAWIDRILSKNLIYHRQRVRIEVLLGDESDCLMAFATPRECARTMQKTGTKYENDEDCQASAIQVSTSVRMQRFAHEFYSVERAENSLHLRRISIDADCCFGVGRHVSKPGFSVY
jgi:hypothetical protein